MSGSRKSLCSFWSRTAMAFCTLQRLGQCMWFLACIIKHAYISVCLTWLHFKAAEFAGGYAVIKLSSPNPHQLILMWWIPRLLPRLDCWIHYAFLKPMALCFSWSRLDLQAYIWVYLRLFHRHATLLILGYSVSFHFSIEALWPTVSLRWYCCFALFGKLVLPLRMPEAIASWEGLSLQSIITAIFQLVVLTWTTSSLSSRYEAQFLLLL